MLVSIIVPVYNVEKYIKTCIESILAQDYNDIELILVDDCSPDNSISIAKEIVGKSKRTTRFITHIKNRGLSGARNSGIKASTGDAIFFIDSDDELHDNTVISCLVAELQATGADIVAGNYQRIYKQDKIVSRRYCQKRIIQDNSNIVNAFCQGSIPITAWNKLIKRDFLLKNNLFFKEGLIHEDELWTFNTIIAANTIVLTGKTTYNYYQQESSIMSNKVNLRIKSSIEIYNEMACAYSKSHKAYNKKLATHINRFAFQRYREIMQIDDTVVKKELYKTLRMYQLAIKIDKSIQEQCMHFHLLFPYRCGFYIASAITNIYSVILKLKQR